MNTLGPWVIQRPFELYMLFDHSEQRVDKSLEDCSDDGLFHDTIPATAY